MRYLKKYEGFDFSKTLPVTTENFLTNFYSCDECNAIWKEFNNTADRCKFCDSDEIEELQEDEWYEIAKLRLDADEIEDLDKERTKSSDKVVDLLNPKLKEKSSDGN